MRPDISPLVAVGPAMVMLPEGVLPGACLLRLVSMNTKLLGEFDQTKEVLWPGVLLTLVKFKLKSVPEPDSEVLLVELADNFNVFIVPAPRTLDDTFQLEAVNPAPEAGVAWKFTTVESKLNSPWKAWRLSALSILEVVTGSVKFVTLVLMLAIGRDTVATAEGALISDDGRGTLAESVGLLPSG